MARPVTLNAPGRPNLRALAPSLLVNAILPFIAYRVLTADHMPTVQALASTAIFPVIGMIMSWVRTRHLDGIGIVSLILILLGVLTSLLSDNVRFYLIKESFLTGLWGLACLASLLFPRPLMFYFGRQFATGGDPAKIAYYDSLWQYPSFRHSTILTTVVWGIAYLAEALLRILFALVLSPGTVLLISPILVYGVTILLIIWTIRYSQQMARRGAAAQARRMQQEQSTTQ